MTVMFVTAIYDIYNAGPHSERSKEIWERFAALASIIPIVIVCSAADADKVPEGATPIFFELTDLETYKCVESYNGLPNIRSAVKDTKEFMIIMNAKVEFMKIAKAKNTSDHYVWIDAGIGKIFKDPAEIYNKIISNTSVPMKSDCVLIPGCWPFPETNIEKLRDRIHWRFCGGFFVVPHDIVDTFHEKMMEGCKEIGDATGAVVWEVNTWSYIESRIPIQWERGDHNESIINCLMHYKAPMPQQETAPAP